MAGQDTTRRNGADTAQTRRYRFGVFEVNPATGELRRQGMLIRLNAQPFQALILLLERAGQLVTREEIERELWPDGTVVDYEHGVNSAVNRIREALRDSAADSRYVQTLARRGYRFVAPVEVVSSTTSDSLSAPFASQPETEAEGGQQSTSAQETSEPRAFGGILATPEDLPRTSYPVVQTLYLLLQAMYLAFYIGALANLAEIDNLLSPLSRAEQIYTMLIVTAAIMIPVRAFVLCAVLFHAPGVRTKFLKLWPFLLVMDELWALSPFLLLHHINVGLALACTTLLVYSPFAQRSLVLMGAGEDRRATAETAK